MPRAQEICHNCGGLGKVGGCPKCGLTPRTQVIVKTMHLDMSADIIPVTYQGKLWEKPGTTEQTPLKFIDFDDKLDKVLQEFLAGRTPRFSMFISSPAKGNKHSFAYSCMQTALVQHFTVAPLLSTSDWRRLYRVSQVNPFYKLYEHYKWDDLISTDVVFLSVDHSEDRYDVISLLKDVLDTRANFNRPTFVISDFRLTELVPKWNQQSYGIIYNPDPRRDLFRYPVILQRFE